jgi:hypothetical protein
MEDLTVSSEAFAKVLHQVAYKAEQVERNAFDLERQATKVVEQLHLGQHLQGYSNQTLIEAATYTAELASLIQVASHIGTCPEDRDVLVHILTVPGDSYKVKVA